MPPIRRNVTMRKNKLLKTFSSDMFNTFTDGIDRWATDDAVGARAAFTLETAQVYDSLPPRCATFFSSSLALQGRGKSEKTDTHTHTQAHHTRNG